MRINQGIKNRFHKKEERPKIRRSLTSRFIENDMRRIMEKGTKPFFRCAEERQEGPRGKKKDTNRWLTN